MILLNTHFDADLPYWSDYLPYLQALDGFDFGSCQRLNDLLPSKMRSESGQPIRFVPSDQLDEAPYELRIYTTGQVSTRLNNWHDLFNAMVWMRFPAIKIAMNAMHFHAWSEQRAGSRGHTRDALTLFDECGVIVFSSHLDKLNALAERRWVEAFGGPGFHTNMGLALCGHAILEKYLSPYKSMTAKALLVHVDKTFMVAPRSDQLKSLDRLIAKLLPGGYMLDKPACLSPLPLAGVPGWWPQEEQSESGFYDDLNVFRPAPDQLSPAPVTCIKQVPG